MNDKVNSGREDGLGQSFKELMHNLLMMHFCDNSMWFSQKIKRNVIAARDSINNQNLPSEYIRIEYMRGFLMTAGNTPNSQSLCVRKIKTATCHVFGH